MKTSAKLQIRKDFVKKDGTCPLYVLVIVNSQTLKIPLNISWPLAFFDLAGSALKKREKNDKDISDYNIIIGNELTKANEIFKLYRLREKELTIETFKHDYYNYNKRRDFLEFWEKALRERLKRKKITHSTHTGHQVSLMKLKGFRPILPFHDVTPKLLEDFEYYLVSKLGNANNTIHKNMRHIRAYLNLAIESGIVVDNPFKKYKLKEEKTTPEFLSIEELKALINLYNADATLVNWKIVLKHFLFSCFTGLRISDLKLITREMILENTLVFVPKKTRSSGKILKIPLEPIALQYVTANAGKLFDTFTEQAGNRILKEIATHLEIKKNLSHHVGRHSFATLFLEMGGQVEVLQELLGHGKIATTMIYVHITHERVKDQMKGRFDKF